jgi:hypothetical protein
MKKTIKAKATKKDKIPTWAINATWVEGGTYYIKAKTLEEAADIAANAPLPDSDGEISDFRIDLENARITDAV